MTTISANTPNDYSRLSLAHLRWIPFAMLLVATAVLALNWNRIPERWIIHWNLRGEADGWSSKTVIGVMLPIFLGMAVCAFLEIISVWIASIRSFGEGYKGKPEAARIMAAATASVLRLMNLAMSILFTVIAIQMPLYPSNSPPFTVALVLGTIIIALIIGFRRIISSYRALKQAGMMEGMEGFNGLVYSNANDPNLWVPKPLGYGYTINFSHRWAWPVFLAILGIPLVVIFLIIVLSAR